MFGWLKNIVVTAVLGIVNDPAFSERLATELNNRVDLPQLTEEEEQEWFEANATALKTAFIRTVEDLS